MDHPLKSSNLASAGARFWGHKDFLPLPLSYGCFRINKSLALGMVRPEHADIGTELEMDILGTIHKITVVAESPYDPKNARLRSQD
jgi:hypothetical protein